MLAIYVFAAVVGLSLLALGMISGEGGVDELDLELDGDLDAEAGDASWQKYFSMRSAAYFMAGFGATGVLLGWTGAGPFWTLLLALGMGTVAAAFITALFGWLRRSEGGFADSSDDYIGAVGDMRLPIRGSTPGSVAIQHRGRTLVLRARSMGEPESDPSTWGRVLVVDVEEDLGILLVQPAGDFLSDGEFGGGSAPAAPEFE